MIAQSACNNEVEGLRSDVSKGRPALVNQRISPHCTSPYNPKNWNPSYNLKSRASPTGIHPTIQKAGPAVINEG